MRRTAGSRSPILASQKAKSLLSRHESLESRGLKGSLGKVLITLLLAVVLTGCSLVPLSPSAPPGTPAAGGSPTSPSVPGSTANPGVPPTATPAPVVRVGSGDKALFNGDIETAMLQYRAAAQDAADPEVRVAALWGLARSQYADGRYDDAVSTLDQLISEYPQSPYAAPA